MWFVQLLDDLGKAMGLPNGTKDMTVENFGKLILEGSDTSVAVFNPFGFREDYGGKDMIPIEEQAEVKRRWPTRTVMLGGGLTPNQGLSETLERMTTTAAISTPSPPPRRAPTSTSWPHWKASSRSARVSMPRSAPPSPRR